MLLHTVDEQRLRDSGGLQNRRRDVDDVVLLSRSGKDLARYFPEVRDAVRDELATRADLVDMEGYAIALACAELGVPVHLVKRVSDNADETAHDWSAAVDGCARDLGAWVADFVRLDRVR